MSWGGGGELRAEGIGVIEYSQDVGKGSWAVTNEGPDSKKLQVFFCSFCVA